MIGFACTGVIGQTFGTYLLLVRYCVGTLYLIYSEDAYWFVIDTDDNHHSFLVCDDNIYDVNADQRDFVGRFTRYSLHRTLFEIQS